LALAVFGFLFAQTSKNPFSKYGYKKQVMYTSSKGEFEEFHGNEDIVEIGSVYFNTKTKSIVGYVDEEGIAEVAYATSAMSVDPLCEKYYWISPYAYCLNNPVRLIDPDGRVVYGTDGNPVTYSNETGLSPNAPTDFQRIGNSMIKTEKGTEMLNVALNHPETISFSINTSNEVTRDESGSPLLGEINRTGLSMVDGNIKVGEHKITINEGAINYLTGSESGENQYKGVNAEDAIGAVAGHEIGHTDPANTRQAYENKVNNATNDTELEPDKIDSEILDQLKAR